MGSFYQDLRYAVRMLRKNPVFTGVAVLTVALGIGANAAVFTFTDAVLLQSLPVKDPDQLTVVSSYDPRESDVNHSFSYPTYQDLRDKNEVFSGVLARGGSQMNVSYEGRSDRIRGELVSGNYFEVLGVRPWLGRLFPDVVGKRVTPTRQEVYYFGTPPGDPRFLDPSMPVWVDYRERLTYGIPGNANRGFKVADDTPGPAFDPTDGRLHNFIGDSQNQGGVWGTFPVLNVDTYEHSYFIDYGSDRKAYLEAFMRNINWDEVNRRFVAASSMAMARK